MNFLGRFFNWFGRVLLPARLRPTVLQYRLTSALEQSVAGVERGATAAAGKVEEAESARPSAVAGFLRWVLHFLLVAAVLVGLYFLNAALLLPRYLHSRFSGLHEFWLPLLFLILYLMAWLGWWLWELTGPDRVANDYPDINKVWYEATHDVAAAGVDLRAVPLYFVLGRPEGREEAVFEAARLPLRPTHARRPGDPLQVYVTAEAVYVTCAGASVLGRLVGLLAEERRAARDLELRPASADALVDTAGTDVARQAAPATMPAINLEQSAPATMLAIDLDQAEGAEPTVAVLTEGERRVVSLLERAEQAGRPEADDQRRALMRSEKELTELTARLRLLCRLIVRDRRPFCPVNGVLVLLPQAALESDSDASLAATACALDLNAIRDEFQVQCPAYVLVCDLQDAPGFGDFLERLPPGQRERRVGQRFPLVPDVEAAALPGVVQQGVGWMCHTLLPSLVYNLFRAEGAAGLASEAVDGNIRLYRLLARLDEQRQRLGRFLTRGLLLENRGPFRLGGVYFAGTGADAEREQAFVAGVFGMLLNNQNHVAWTEQALASEAGYRRWASVSWFTALALVVAGLIATYLLWQY